MVCLNQLTVAHGRAVQPYAGRWLELATLGAEVAATSIMGPRKAVGDLRFCARGPRAVFDDAHVGAKAAGC